MNENPFDEEFLTKLENIQLSEKFKQISEAIIQRARIVLVSSIEGSPVSLSETVLVALLTTATVNVLAPAFLRHFPCYSEAA